MRPGLRVAAVVLGGLLVPAASASAADVMYGTTGTDLVRFNATTPGVLDAALPIRNLPNGVSIVALDERPVTLGLYGMGSDARLYRISKTTGLATGPIGPALASTPTGPVGIDFNATVDRLRLVTGDELNLRVNPTTGAQVDGDAGLGGVQPDTPLAPAGSIASVAYDRSVHGSTLTTLFAIDTAADRLVRIGGVDGVPSPNGGAVTPVGALGVDAGTSADLDISAAGTAYALLPPAGGGAPVLSRIDLTSGAATAVGAVALVAGAPVTDLAVGDPPPTGLSVNNAASPQALVRFPTDSPLEGEVQALLFPPAGTITSLDRRPSTGDLIAAASDGALYRVNEDTGALTRIGDPGANAPALASIGFDIDPTSDTVRVITPAEVNVRLNPFTAPFTTTPDTAPAYAGGDTNTGADPTIEAIAYTDSRPGAITTSLYGIDTTLNVLVKLNAPNQGTLTTIGALGVDPGPNAALDFPPTGTSGYVLTQLQGDTVTRLLRIQTAIGVTNNPAGGTHELGVVGFGAGSTTLRGLTLVPSGQVSAPAAVAATEHAGAARITLTRSAGDGGAGNVEYDVTAGTATAGADVTTTGGTVTFEDGQRTATIEVPVVDDGAVEDPETFTVVLARAGGGLGVAAGAATTTVTITSDDVPAPAPTPTPTPTPTGGGGGTVATPDTVRPVALISLVAPRLRTLRAGGLRLRLLVGEPATASVVATVDARTRARLKLKSAKVTGTAAPRFASGAARTVTLKLTKDAKARLAKVRSVVLTVTAVVTDTAGNRTTVREKVTVRR